MREPPVLKKRVIGKDDVDIAAIINKLENSDWVKEGLAYYEINNGICPFCQQETSGAFAKSLGEYFDDAFMVDTRAIERPRKQLRNGSFKYQARNFQYYRVAQ